MKPGIPHRLLVSGQRLSKPHLHPSVHAHRAPDTFRPSLSGARAASKIRPDEAPQSVEASRFHRFLGDMEQGNFQPVPVDKIARKTAIKTVSLITLLGGYAYISLTSLFQLDGFGRLIAQGVGNNKFGLLIIIAWCSLIPLIWILKKLLFRPMARGFSWLIHIFKPKSLLGGVTQVDLELNHPDWYGGLSQQSTDILAAYGFREHSPERLGIAQLLKQQDELKRLVVELQSKPAGDGVRSTAIAKAHEKDIQPRKDQGDGGDAAGGVRKDEGPPKPPPGGGDRAAQPIRATDDGREVVVQQRAGEPVAQDKPGGGGSPGPKAVTLADFEAVWRESGQAMAICVEDRNAAALMKALLAQPEAGDLAKTAFIYFSGGADAVRKLATEIKAKQADAPVVGVLDADQTRSDRCLVFPGPNLPPEVAVVSALKAKGWQGVAARFGLSDPEFAECVIEEELGKITGKVRQKKKELKKDVIWEILCEEFARSCFTAEERATWISEIQTLLGLQVAPPVKARVEVTHQQNVAATVQNKV